MDDILSEASRPKTVEDCILPEHIKMQIRGLISEGNLPSMLFVGGPGCGKTTLAYAIANEMCADVLFINASLNNSIDTIRTNVLQFASTMSFTNAKKITILDEADGLSNDAQKALRGLVEQFSKNHSIIFTANFGGKMIDAIKSRCVVVDFKIAQKEKPTIAAKFMKRLMTILDSRDIEYDKDAIAALVMKKFPDYRSIFNEIQGYSAGGRIDAGILSNLSEESFNVLITVLKSKKFSEMRKWVAEHSDLESTELFRLFYDCAIDKLESKSIPELILHLAEFSYKDYFVVDKEINRCAFLTTVMLSQNIVWK